MTELYFKHKPALVSSCQMNGEGRRLLYKTDAFIRLNDVFKIYPNPAGDFMALKGINLDIHKGEFIGIIGKSGAGKSSLVNMISGVDQLTSGEIWVSETPVHELNEDELALWRGKNIGVIYQSFQLMPKLSLMDNVMLPMDFCGLYEPGKSRERARQLLEDVELGTQINKLPTAISGGQQQRVAIARALANDPSLIIADEPTGNLDSVTAETVFKLFENLVRQGKTLIVVSHDHALAKRFSRVLTIADGVIIDESKN